MKSVSWLQKSPCASQPFGGKQKQVLLTGATKVGIIKIAVTNAVGEQVR
jgi:hypothetical protein